jgi:hypothetical protein
MISSVIDSSHHSTQVQERSYDANYSYDYRCTQQHAHRPLCSNQQLALLDSQA